MLGCHVHWRLHQELPVPDLSLSLLPAEGGEGPAPGGLGSSPALPFATKSFLCVGCECRSWVMLSIHLAATSSGTSRGLQGFGTLRVEGAAFRHSSKVSAPAERGALKRGMALIP